MTELSRSVWENIDLSLIYKGLIAQLVEDCIDIAEVMGSNPVQT